MNKYRLISKKGQGTFSDVIKAQNIKHKQYVAIKCMKQHYDSVKQVNSLKEIQALKKLSPHPHIIDLLEVLFDEPTGRLALVFELMDQNLYEFMERKKPKIQETDVKKIMYQILKAIYHMHKHGIFHRDIKPENILISGDTKVKLADFGSCRNKNSEQPYTEYISTRWYRAPECLLTDGYYNEKMDIWGAGCVMFENLTSIPLFPGNNELDQVHRINDIIGTPTQELLNKFKGRASHMEINFKPNQRGKGFDKYLKNHSEECIDLIKKMLVYDPQERISAKDCLKHPFFNSLREKEYREHSNSLHCQTSNSKSNIRTNSTLFSVRHNNHHSNVQNNTNYTQYTEYSERDNSNSGKVYNQMHNGLHQSSQSVNNTLQSNSKNLLNSNNQINQSMNGLNSSNSQFQQSFTKQNSNQSNNQQQYQNSNNHNHLKKIIKHHSQHHQNTSSQNSIYTQQQQQQQQQQNGSQEPMFPELRTTEENRLHNQQNQPHRLSNMGKFSNDIEEEEPEDVMNESVQKQYNNHNPKEKLLTDGNTQSKNLPYLKKYYNNNSTSTFMKSQNNMSIKNQQNNSINSSNNSLQFKILPQTIKRGRIPTIMPSDLQQIYHNNNNGGGGNQNNNSNSCNVNNSYNNGNNLYQNHGPSNNQQQQQNKQSPDLKKMSQFQQLQQQLQHQQQQKYGKKVIKGRPKQKYISPYGKKEFNKI